MKLAKVVLTIFPFFWTIGMVPFANRVWPMVLGLPFLAFWLVCSIPVSLGCIWGLYQIDLKHDRDAR